MNNDGWIEWLEPFGSGNDPVFMRIKKQTAIDEYRRRGQSRGPVNYTDEELLNSFMLVHWAYEVEEPKS